MQLLEAAVYYIFFHLTIFFVDVYGKILLRANQSRINTMVHLGRCPLIDGGLPKISNGYRSNVANVNLYSDNTAEGYYDVSCEPGYALNTDIGGRITCLSSDAWSQPLPQCNCMLFYSTSDNGILVFF